MLLAVLFCPLALGQAASWLLCLWLWGPPSEALHLSVPPHPHSQEEYLPGGAGE